MNNADITAFDNRVNTFGDNVRKFADRIRQVQQQMQELLNSFSDVDQNQTTEQATMNDRSASQTVESQAHTNKQPTVQASTTIAPESQVASEPAQKNAVNADQDAINIINSLDIPSLLDVGNKSQASTMQSSASITDDSAFMNTQSSTVQTQAPVQTKSKHETALDNDAMMKAVSDIDINQIMNTAMNQASQKTTRFIAK